MTAKDYLKQVKIKSAAIENLQRDKEDIKQTMYAMGRFVEGERVQISRNIDRLGSIYACIDEKERLISEMILDIIEFRLKVSQEISRLDNAKHINLLYMRYVQFCSWDEITVDIRYSTRYILKLHKEALENFQKMHSTMLQKIDDCIE